MKGHATGDQAKVYMKKNNQAEGKLSKALDRGFTGGKRC